MTLAPCESRFSTSLACCSSEEPASAEMYSAPTSSRAAWMAGSSRSAQRSSW